MVIGLEHPISTMCTYFLVQFVHTEESKKMYFNDQFMDSSPNTLISPPFGTTL